MQSDFYTSVSIQGDNILLRGYSDGKPVKEKVIFSPTLYLPSNTKTKYRTLEGEYVSPLQPGSIHECRNFVGKYKDVSGFRLFGNTDYVYQFIGDHYQEEIEYDYSLLNVVTIDIETTCENGFPDIENPTEKVIAITLHTKDKTYCYGLGKYSIGKENVEERQYDREDDLLRDFLVDWVAISPDIVTGWNIRFFDIPYLVNRIRSVLSESEAKKLSPWKILKDKTVFKMNREHKVYELTGISILDYYELYTTFTYVNQESYN